MFYRILSYHILLNNRLHEASQVYRDIVNALHWLNEGGTIVLHDCNPRGFLDISASYPMHPDAAGNWNGDSWKATVWIRLWSFVEVVVVDADHGIGVIRRRRNNHPLSQHWQERLIAPSSPSHALSNSDLRQHRSELIRLVTVQGMLDWLAEEDMNEP